MKLDLWNQEHLELEDSVEETEEADHGNTLRLICEKLNNKKPALAGFFVTAEFIYGKIFTWISVEQKFTQFYLWWLALSLLLF
jgi:hypothetical protein